MFVRYIHDKFCCLCWGSTCGESNKDDSFCRFDNRIHTSQSQTLCDMHAGMGQNCVLLHWFRFVQVMLEFQQLCSQYIIVQEID